LNILRLLVQQKPVVVFIGPRKSFVEARTTGDFERLAAGLNSAAARRLREQAVNEGLADGAPQPAQLRL